MGLCFWTEMDLYSNCVDIIVVGLRRFAWRFFWRRLSFDSSMPNAVCLLTPESKASRLAIPEPQMLVSTTTLLRASCTTTTTSCRGNRQYRVSFFYYRGCRDSTTQQSPNTEKTASTIRRCSCMSCGRLVHGLQTAQSGMRRAREMEMWSASSYSRRFHSLASYIHTCSAGLPFSGFLCN
jgi:hypothetical protein